MELTKLYVLHNSTNYEISNQTIEKIILEFLGIARSYNLSLAELAGIFEMTLQRIQCDNPVTIA